MSFLIYLVHMTAFLLKSEGQNDEGDTFLCLSLSVVGSTFFYFVILFFIVGSWYRSKGATHVNMSEYAGIRRELGRGVRRKPLSWIRDGIRIEGSDRASECTSMSGESN